MPEISKHYTLNVMTLSPLHIGTGRELLRGYDFAVHGGKTWRIDEDKLLDAALGDDEEFSDALLGRPADELLHSEDYKVGSPFFRYVVKGTPRSHDTGAHLREQIKDAFDRPYLPGSSLKGALRTALLDTALSRNPRALDTRRLERSRKYAARSLERELLGRDPNHDLLRALHVADSQPLNPSRSLTIENVQVVSGGAPGSPIEVEALKPNVTLRTSIKLDLALFSPQAERTLGFGERRNWLEGLMAVCRARAEPLLAAERDWCAAHRTLQPLAEFYASLHQVVAEMPDNRTLLQVGWGGGWLNKTIGNRLSARDREDVIGQYGLARGKRHSGDPFPKSRRVAIDSQGRPAAPLGWVLIEMKPEVR